LILGLVPFTNRNSDGIQVPVDARGCHAKEIAMDSAEHCRMQSEECRRLLALAQNEAEVSVLTYLSRSWIMIANQIDRYVEIVKKGTAQKK
jgi:hypothetical protein